MALHLLLLLRRLEVRLYAGVCGYGTTVGNCTQMTMQQFCSNSTLKPLTFNGGISAAPQGNLGLLVLAL